MTRIDECSAIKDLRLVTLAAFGDERGRFMETFRREWFPRRSWEQLQSNRSDSRAGVLRGLHFHRRQIDYWYCPFGLIRAGFYDLRVGSPTEGARFTVLMGDEHPVGLYVPVGVAHGFAALRDSTLTYIVDRYYDPGDELGLAWDDPDAAVDWGLPGPPLLSDRDRRNPRLREIPVASRVRYQPE